MYKTILQVFILLCFLSWNFSASATQFPIDALSVISSESASQLETLLTVESVGGRVEEVEFNTESKRIGIASRDGFLLWNLEQEAANWRLPLGFATRVSFSPDGKKMLVAAYPHLYLWNDVNEIRAWQELKNNDEQSIGSIGDTQFSSDGSEIVGVLTQNYGIYRWQADSGKLLLEDFEFAADENSMVTAAKLSHDGSIAALFRRRPSQYIDFVDTTNGNLLSSILAVDFSDPTEGGILAELLTFTPDNQALLVNVSIPGGIFDSSLVVLNVQGEIVQQFQYDYEVYWSSAAFSPDGNLLILANAADQGIYFFDPTTMEQLGVIESGDKGLRMLAISPDGKLLATGSGDGTVRLWGVPAGD